jgi:hypothetical protein
MTDIPLPDPGRTAGRRWHPEELARDRVTVAELIDAYDRDPTTPPADEPVTLLDLEDDDEPPGTLTRGGFMAAEMRAIAHLGRDRFGLVFREAAGWTTRGRTWAVFNPTFGVIDHHTAAPFDTDRVLIDGRPDVPGPLCQWAHHTDGVVVLIAAGLANHAGVASVSSAEAYGIEATGPTPTGATGPGAFRQYDAYRKLNAAIRIYRAWDRSRQLGHKEIALPLGRKVDPMFDMAQFRDATDRLIAGSGAPVDWFASASVAELEAVIRRSTG